MFELIQGEPTRVIHPTTTTGLTVSKEEPTTTTTKTDSVAMATRREEQLWAVLEVEAFPEEVLE